MDSSDDTGFLAELFDDSRFMPHGYCFLWQQELVWMHVISDLAIVLAYFSIPATILYLLHKHGTKLPFRWVFFMFAIFIVLCGITHLVNIVTLWYPYYYLSAVIKLLTGAASIATAVMIFPLVPILIEKFKQVDDTDSSDDTK